MSWTIMLLVWLDCNDISFHKISRLIFNQSFENIEFKFHIIECFWWRFFWLPICLYSPIKYFFFVSYSGINPLASQCCWNHRELYWWSLSVYYFRFEINVWMRKLKLTKNNSNISIKYVERNEKTYRKESKSRSTNNYT